MFFQCANAIFRVPLELELILHVPEEPRKTSSPFHLDINSTHLIPAIRIFRFYLI